MEKTESENDISKINSNVFFKEFTYSKNDFIDNSTKHEHEFSDNVVWIDSIFFIFEIKERKANESEGEVKWFENKIINKSVKQIKKTHNYLKKYPDIPIINEKGHTKNISEANLNDIQSIIVYSTNSDFNEEKRFRKFYNSKKVGLIHLFHSEDYYWICKYLLTPAEVKEYLIFREELYVNHLEVVNNLPEQYVLGHFLETLDTSIIDPKYINNLNKINQSLYDFDVSFLIENFDYEIKLNKDKTDYYYIIAEIAKLNRGELAEFKKRYLKTIEKCQEDEIHIPYRIYLPRTDCGFVFIPLNKKMSTHWKNALTNYTSAQMYDQKATKCVGVTIFETFINKEKCFEMFWIFIDGDWEFNEEMERLLSSNYPFREVKTKRIDNRYIE